MESVCHPERSEGSLFVFKLRFFTSFRMTDFLMTNKTVLVTGASRGLGRALAMAFAKDGYQTALHYFQNESEAKKTKEWIEKAGGTAALFQADIRQSSQVNRLIKDTASQFGRINVLVNNAGSVRNQLISKMSDDDWKEAFASNLDGAFYATRAVIPLMRAQKGGSIINMASFSAAKGIRGAANYSAAKAGLITFTKNTAIEEGSFGIRANAILPGFHVTDINKDVWGKYEADIRKQHLLSQMPDRDEMARFVVQVANITTVTGQVFAFESRLV